MKFAGTLKAEHYDDFFEQFFSTKSQKSSGFIDLVKAGFFISLFGWLMWSNLSASFYRVLGDAPLLNKVLIVMLSAVALIIPMSFLFPLLKRFQSGTNNIKAPKVEFPREALKQDRLLGEVNYEICARDLFVIKAADQCRYKWEAFERFDETEKSFLLFIDVGLCEILPKNMFETTVDMDEFRSVLIAQIGA